MSRRGGSDFKTSSTIFVIVIFMGIVLVCLGTYFVKRNEIKVDGGRVNPYTSDFKSFDLEGLGDEFLDEHGNPDIEALGSQFKEFQNEMGQ